jgi:hypothetical protein
VVLANVGCAVSVVTYLSFDKSSMFSRWMLSVDPSAAAGPAKADAQRSCQCPKNHDDLHVTNSNEAGICA